MGQFHQIGHTQGLSTVYTREGAKSKLPVSTRARCQAYSDRLRAVSTEKGRATACPTPFHVRQEIGGLIVLDFEINVTRDAKRIRRHHGESWKQHVQVRGNDLLHPDKRYSPTPPSSPAACTALPGLHPVCVPDVARRPLPMHFDAGKALAPLRVVDGDR